MTADVRGSAQREYLDGLRAELADLPAPEMGEILDDVGGYLADVGAELGPDADLAAFRARLGTPQAYAAELRAAAGCPTAPRVTVSSGEGAARFALATLIGSTGLVLLGSVGFLLGSSVGMALMPLALLIALVSVPVVWHGGPRMAAVAALPAVRRAAGSLPAPDSAGGKVTAFVASLQPAWWLLRAVLAAAVLALPFQTQPEVGPVLLLSLLFVPLSVWLGFRSRADRRLLWLVVPLNTFAGLLALLVPVAFAAFGVPGGSTSSAVPYFPGLWQDGERQIEDIRPVDAAGVPLSEVYLFDQDGRPIDTGDLCGGGSSVDPARPYPRGTTGYDDRTGECVVVRPGPLVVAVPTTIAPTTIAPTLVPPGPTTQAPPTG
jgi:uncharacterized membrane protein